MRVTFINKSDSLGGAAVVTLRLVEALRGIGVDARLLVAHRATDHEYVAEAAGKWRMKYAFLADRLPLLARNGFSRRTLFSIDAARAGLPLWRHPWVREADIVAPGWINQGMLSLNGIRRLADMGKPVVWTMHDMWCMTGVCHHAHSCRGYMQGCGHCRLLGICASASDLSARVWKRKQKLYSRGGICFVAVSNWLARKAAESSLLGDERVEVIPNAFPVTPASLLPAASATPSGHIMMVAARLDDHVKGMPLLVEATKAICRMDSGAHRRLHLDLVGDIRDTSALSGLALPFTLHGRIADGSRLRQLYGKASAVVSPSLFETLPGTLVEGQDMGAVPVAFDSGGQADIIDHLHTGYLAVKENDARRSGENLAQGILWAVEASASESVRNAMRRSVETRFGAEAVARRYLQLFETL